MAKTSAIEKNKKRKRLTARHATKRAALKAMIRDQSKPMEDRFSAVQRLAQLPRDGSAVRVRNRCELTGRPRGYHRKMRISRIALRELALSGQIPGMVKSSW
jgi:small subunit ribosomal protein S14